MDAWSVAIEQCDLAELAHVQFCLNDLVERNHFMKLSIGQAFPPVSLPRILLLGFCLTVVTRMFAADALPAEDFLVYPRVITEGPSITPYLRYQADMAWHRDGERRRIWA